MDQSRNRSIVDSLQRIAPKTAVLLLVIVLSPILLLVGVNLVVNQRLLEQEIEARQLETTQIAATDINAFVQNIQVNLDQIGQSWWTLKPEDKNLAPWLQGLAHNNSLYRDLWIIDAEGQELAYIENGMILTRLENRLEDELFFRPQRGETYFSTIRLMNGRPQLTLTRPIWEGEKVVGVIGAEIDLEQPWTIIQNLKIGETGAAFLVDRRGNLLVHGKLTERPNFSANPAIANALSASPELKLYTYINPIEGEVLTSALLIPDTRWVLAIERPSQEAYQVIRQAEQVTVAILVAGVVIALLSSLFITRQITRPIYALRRAAQNYSQGNWNAQLPLHSRDEIGDLARAFRDMGEQIQSNIQVLNERNQELRVATAKAREAARLKSEFLATMSHELRTPLNAIIGFSDMLLMGMSGPLNEKQTHKVSRLQENGKRLLDLVNNVLDLTRIEAGRIELVTKAFSPAELGERLAAQMASLAQPNGLEFKTEIDPLLPPRLLGDEKRLEQIIVNLLSNAFKFTEKGGVTLRLACGEDAAHWQIAVSDTGVGIPPHAYEYIFDEFRQLDGSSRRAFKGTGLGLAITRQLVRVMDGQIKIESKLGEGSTFTVILPRTETLSEEA